MRPRPPHRVFGRRLAKGARSYRCDGRRYKPRVSGAHRSQLDSSAFHRGFIDDSLLRALVISGWVFASARSRGVDLQKAKTDERGANTGVHQPPATRASRCLARRLRVGTRRQSIGVATSLQELLSSCATTRVWQNSLKERRARHEQGW